MAEREVCSPASLARSTSLLRYRSGVSSSTATAQRTSRELICDRPLGRRSGESGVQGEGKKG